MKAITVLLVDDIPAVRDALRILLSLEPDITVVGEAEGGTRAIAAALRLQPDVVVMDYEMPRLNGLEALQALRDAGISAPVVVLSIHDDVSLKRAATNAGACSFITKHQPSSHLVAAIRDAAASRREEDTS